MKRAKPNFKFARNCAIACLIGWLTISPLTGKNNNQPQQPMETIYVKGGASSTQYEVGRSGNNLANKEFFREMLVKHFPDWENRVSMENQQAIIYNKAQKKLKEYRNFSPLLKNHEKWLTDEEKFAIDYFHGRGIYKKYQDPKTPPNLFDSRQTFLKKMENEEMREKFLKSYNRLNSIKEN